MYTLNEKSWGAKHFVTSFMKIAWAVLKIIKAFEHFKMAAIGATILKALSRDQIQRLLVYSYWLFFPLFEGLYSL